MKRHPKLLQADTRGQIVIPKEIRQALGIDESTGFFAYMIGNEGIFLKKIDSKPLSEHPEVQELKDKAEKIGVRKKNVDAAEKEYKKDQHGGFEDI